MAFLVIFWLGLGTPAILRQNPNKLSFGQFRKKVGIGSDPRPPPWAKFPTFAENLFCKLPLKIVCNKFSGMHRKDIKGFEKCELRMAMTTEQLLK